MAIHGWACPKSMTQFQQWCWLLSIPFWPRNLAAGVSKHLLYLPSKEAAKKEKRRQDPGANDATMDKLYTTEWVRVLQREQCWALSNKPQVHCNPQKWIQLYTHPPPRWKKTGLNYTKSTIICRKLPKKRRQDPGPGGAQKTRHHWVCVFGLMNACKITALIMSQRRLPPPVLQKRSDWIRDAFRNNPRAKFISNGY